MNFKAIAVAASLVFAAGATFAADIDLAGSTYVSATPALADLMTAAETALTLGDTNASNNALIYQDESAGNAEQIALIDQVGLNTGYAAIFQLGNTNSVANIAYIQQNATTLSRAVIVQR
jgi:hypothetical protein